MKDRITEVCIAVLLISIALLWLALYVERSYVSDWHDRADRVLEVYRKEQQDRLRWEHAALIYKEQLEVFIKEKNEANRGKQAKQD